jgi:hypothetical protein
MAKPRKRQQRRPAASKPRAQQPPGQVGRRPSQPGFLFLVGLLWIAAGVGALVALSASWKLIPAILFFGIGFLWLRGAATAINRQEAHGSSS